MCVCVHMYVEECCLQPPPPPPPSVNLLIQAQAVIRSVPLVKRGSTLKKQYSHQQRAEVKFSQYIFSPNNAFEYTFSGRSRYHEAYSEIEREHKSDSKVQMVPKGVYCLPAQAGGGAKNRHCPRGGWGAPKVPRELRPSLSQLCQVCVSSVQAIWRRLHAQCGFDQTQT